MVTSGTNRIVNYPGLRIHFVRGPGPLADDVRFLGAHASSLPRALLENLSRTRGSPKNVSLAVIERRLEQALREGGEAELDRLRDRAREIAAEFEMHAELQKVEALIGALLGTRSASRLTTANAKARARGRPFDERCLERLQVLVAELQRRTLPNIDDDRGFADHFRNKAFFEAYFSNYIEGTTFELPVAEAIVFEKKIPPRRPKDAHDITSTFNIVSDPNEVRRTPATADELVNLLTTRHATLMAERPEVDPGRFKDAVNRAGDTVFVHPDYVLGTLERGFALLAELPGGLARSIFTMFLVADVHPFNDGNGRVARIMMNAELVAAGQATIIIPTVYRDEYIDTLRALSRQQRPAPVVEMLVKAQRFSSWDFSDYQAAVKHMSKHNWFKEPGKFKLVF